MSCLVTIAHLRVMEGVNMKACISPAGAGNCRGEETAVRSRQEIDPVRCGPSAHWSYLLFISKPMAMPAAMPAANVATTASTGFR